MMKGNWKTGVNSWDEAKASIRSLACIEPAHNPAVAGPRVQIPPPQPISSCRMPATYRVYVLQNREGKFYVGLSDDVARRIEQHNSGSSRWTKIGRASCRERV